MSELTVAARYAKALIDLAQEQNSVEETRDDMALFHHTLRAAIDPFGADLYSDYKKRCDEYFVNKHRGNEMRGIGGVFFHVK